MSYVSGVATSAPGRDGRGGCNDQAVTRLTSTVAQPVRLERLVLLSIVTSTEGNHAGKGNTQRERVVVIRKLSSGGYRLYSRKRNPKTGRRRNLGTFKTRAAAERHERAVQFFKRG